MLSLSSEISSSRRSINFASNPQTDVEIKRNLAPSDTAICYRFTDDLKHLKFRVKLWKVEDQHRLPEIAEGICDQGSGTIQSSKPVEIMEFTWQEKIFSPTELKKYSRLHKSPTPNERTYYEKITELLRKGDNYESRLLNKRSNVVERILFTGIDGDDIDEWNLTESDKESRCQRVNPKLDKCRQMVVMGQFPSASKESGKVVNIRLCQIRVYDGGSMVMMPGLSVQNTAYRFEISNNDIYEFSIENISGSFTEDEYEEERKIFSDIMKYNISLRKSAVENEFTEVPKLPYRIRVSVLGEIISAYDFSRSNLCVHYLIELSNGWICDDQQQATLSCYTQQCQNTYNRKTRRYESHFCYPFEVQLLGTSIPPQRPPTIYFQVSSYDMFGRSYVEGYGQLSVPPFAGVYEVEVPTWKPFGNRQQRMREWFLGGTLDLDSIQWSGKMDAQACLNKYGFQTETSGKLKIRLNIVHQASQFQRQTPHSDQHPKPASNIRAIQDALVRAKKRLEILRGSKQDM